MEKRHTLRFNKKKSVKCVQKFQATQLYRLRQIKLPLITDNCITDKSTQTNKNIITDREWARVSEKKHSFRERELVAERDSSRRENERAIKLCPKTHRKFKRHNPGTATPIVHPGRRRFRDAIKIQRRNSAADAPQHVLRGRNDGPPDGVPGHGPELPDPRAQGGRLPAGQPDEPAEHPAQQRWPASVIEKNAGVVTLDGCRQIFVPKTKTHKFILVLQKQAKLYAIFR